VVFSQNRAASRLECSVKIFVGAQQKQETAYGIILVGEQGKLTVTSEFIDKNTSQITLFWFHHSWIFDNFSNGIINIGLLVWVQPL